MREKSCFSGLSSERGGPGAARLLLGWPVAKGRRQDVLDGGPAINPHILANILAKHGLFLKFGGSGERWGCGELVWD